MAQLASFNPTTCLPAASNGARPDLVTVSNDRMYAFKLDATTDQAFTFQFVLPRTPSGTITLLLHGIMASATTGSVRAQSQIGAFTPGDSTDLDTTFSLDTANSGGSTVPGTAGYPFTVSITVSNVDGWAVGDLVLLRINRDADQTSGTDDASGDWYFLSGVLNDTA